MSEVTIAPIAGPPTRAARQARTALQNWAAPGGRHDRLVNISHWLLPVAIGVLAAFLVMAPLTMTGDVSFLLDKNKVDVAHERMKTQAATYRGQDQKGQAFAIRAGSAVQASSAVPIVRINVLDAQIALPKGPATLKANTGRYDIDSQRVALDGPIAFRGPDGYRLDTRDSVVDLKTRLMESGSAVTGTVPQGRFSANKMRADLNTNTVTLDGNARLHLTPGKAR